MHFVGSGLQKMAKLESLHPDLHQHFIDSLSLYWHKSVSIYEVSTQIRMKFCDLLQTIASEMWLCFKLWWWCVWIKKGFLESYHSKYIPVWGMKFVFVFFWNCLILTDELWQALNMLLLSFQETFLMHKNSNDSTASCCKQQCSNLGWREVCDVYTRTIFEFVCMLSCNICYICCYSCMY